MVSMKYQSQVTLIKRESHLYHLYSFGHFTSFSPARLRRLIQYQFNTIVFEHLQNILNICSLMLNRPSYTIEKGFVSLQSTDKTANQEGTTNTKALWAPPWGFFVLYFLQCTLIPLASNDIMQQFLHLVAIQMF